MRTLFTLIATGLPVLYSGLSANQAIEPPPAIEDYAKAFEEKKKSSSRAIQSRDYRLHSTGLESGMKLPLGSESESFLESNLVQLNDQDSYQ